MYESKNAKICLAIGLLGAGVHYGSAFYGQWQAEIQAYHQRVIRTAEQRHTEILQQSEVGSQTCRTVHQRMKIVTFTPWGTQIGTVRKGRLCMPSGLQWTLVP